MVAINSLDWKSFDCLAQKEKSTKVSDRYSFIPTSQPIETLIEAGWYVNSISENYVVKADNSGFQKHVVRMRHTKDAGKLDVGDVIFEIIISNAHNGSAMFHIMAGMYVCICSNQMTTSDGLVASYKIKHIGYKAEAVHMAVDNIVESAPRISSRVKEFRSLEMTTGERMSYAKKALALMYTKDRLKRDFNLIKTAENVLVPQRVQEEKPTLWNTLNIIQEKIIKGDRFLVQKGKSEAMASRKVKSVDRDVFINRGLWDITEEFANKKGGDKVTA